MGIINYRAVQLVILLTLTVSSRPLFALPSSLAIIPQPVSIETDTNSVRLSEFTKITCTAEGLACAQHLQEKLDASGLSIPIDTEATSDEIAIRLMVTEYASEKSKEAYRLGVGENQIVVESSDSAGLFYGVQSLLQLLPTEVYGGTADLTNWRIPFVEIEDWPRFAWRGLMIDISRHFFSKETLKQTIDLMAMHKLNRLHLHLTDDPGWRIEIEAYPKLTSLGAAGDLSRPDGPEAHYLTKRDIRELVAYASDRHVLIVPEIDMPGHAGAAARAYPEYFDGSHTFNPGNPETFKFVETILGEVTSLFPGPYVHFGGDEVRNHHWEKLPEIQSFMQRHEYEEIQQVEAHFARFVADQLIAHGKVPIGWDEIAGFGVDQQTIVQWWRGRQPQILEQAVKDGYRVIISPANYVYLDYPSALGEPGAPWEGNDNGPNTLELIYGWKPVPDSFSEQEEKRVLGVQACVWTEFIKTERYLQFMVFPRIAALADVAWRPKGTKDFKKFSEHLDVQCRRYQAWGVNYRALDEYATEYMRH